MKTSDICFSFFQYLITNKSKFLLRGTLFDIAVNLPSLLCHLLLPFLLEHQAHYSEGKKEYQCKTKLLCFILQKWNKTKWKKERIYGRCLLRNCNPEWGISYWEFCAMSLVLVRYCKTRLLFSTFTRYSQKTNTVDTHYRAHVTSRTWSPSQTLHSL